MATHDDLDINISQNEESELSEKEYSDILGLEGMAGGGEAALDLSNNYSPNGNEKTMISSFDVNGIPSASYETPENSKFYFSIPLRDAMNEYGDSVMYHVFVDVFSNKEQLASNSSQVKEECERLSNIGYIVAYETYFDGETYHYYFTLHATYDELTEFVASENYGYFMFLYDERVE